MSAESLLSQNLPKASNFYISYFILQGFAMSATRIVHLASIFRHQIVPQSGGNPRLISAKYHRLRKIHWGAVYPVFTNMAVIGESQTVTCEQLLIEPAISYSLIAPIVLGVAALGLSIVYITYRYNLLYVYSSERDTRGLHYPRALNQTLTGVYLAEICLVGLFTLKGAYGPIVLTFGLIIFTSLIHVSLNDALSPLLYNLPRTLAAEEELRKQGNDPFLASNLSDKNDADITAVQDAEAQGTGYDSDFDPSDPTDLVVSHGDQSSRAIEIEGADKAIDLTTTALKSVVRKKINATPIPLLLQKADFWSYWITPDPSIKPSFLMRWLHPEVFESYHVLRDSMPKELREMDTSYADGVLKDAYSPPSVRNKSPRLWILRDPAGVSVQEVLHSGKVIEISDEGAWIDDEGRLSLDLDGETSRWVLRDWERVKF